MKAFFKYIAWLFAGRVVKRKLRSGALHSLRMYINVVKGTRKASMLAVLGVMGLSSIAIGFFLLIGGLLWLANLNPQAYPWIMVGVGALLTVAGIAGYIFAFRQKLWVDMSRINELTTAALAQLPADERPANPLVTKLWGLAAEARIREHSRLEGQLPTPPFNEEPPHLAKSAAESAAILSLVDEPSVAARPAPRFDTSMRPATT